MPTKMGYIQKMGAFQRTAGAALLKENPLTDKLKYFKNAIQAVAYLTNSTVFPLKFFDSKCKSLLCFPSARPQAGLRTRPQLVNAQRTFETIQAFHVDGRNAIGTGNKLNARIHLDTANPVLDFPAIEDSSIESRVANWLRARNLNALRRSKEKQCLKPRG